MRSRLAIFWRVRGSRAKTGLAHGRDPSPESHHGSSLRPPALARPRPRTCYLPPPAPRLAPRPAAAGRPLRQGPPHRHQLAPRRRCRPPLGRQVLLPGRPRTPRRPPRRPAAALRPAPARPRRAAAVRRRRQPLAALRQARSGRRHPPQSHPGADRPGVPLRPRLGHPVLGRRPPPLGRPGPAAAGAPLRPPPGHAARPPAAALVVRHQAGAGRRARRLGGRRGPVRRPGASSGWCWCARTTAGWRCSAPTRR
jgi:hypothetical protein